MAPSRWPNANDIARLRNRLDDVEGCDYLALGASGISFGGIAWCHAAKYSIGQLVQLLLLVHGVMDQESMRNHVEFL